MDPDAVDRFVALADTAMIAVTVSVDDERSGCLVGFWSQCSIEPRRLALWLSVENHTTSLIGDGSVVGVHLLTSADHDLAELFGGETGDEVDKFAALADDAWTSEHGAPTLARCPNRVVGRVVRVVDDGSCDHRLAIVEPIAARADAAATPLRLSDVDDIDAGHPTG